MTNKNKPPASAQPQRVAPMAPQPNDTMNALAASAAPAPQTSPPAASQAADHEMQMPSSQPDAVTSDDQASTEHREPGAEQGPGRRTRIPFGAAQAKLSYPPRPGFHRHWFRDDPGRVERAKAAGYDHVEDPLTGQPVSRLGGVADGGGGLSMYLMEQPQHWHDEDVALGQKPVDEIDRAIRHGAIGREKAGAESDVRYQPEGRGIKITAR
jgi:hypothetical protein